jgi:hypothetical protein
VYCIDIADFRNILCCELNEECIEESLGHSPLPTDQCVLIQLMPVVIGRRDFMKDAKDYPMVSSSLCEVQKSCSLQWHSVQQIKAIAFLFHIEDVNEGRYACSGIKNAFIVRSAAPVYLRARSTPIAKADFDL